MSTEMPGETSVIAETMALRRDAISPRYSPPPTPVLSLVIHAAVLGFWVLLFVRAFTGGGGIWAWSAGLAYIAYDTLLIVFVFVQTLELGVRPTGRERPHGASSAAPASMTVIVAAHDERAALPATLAALLAQTQPADTVLIADDGSTDGSDLLLEREYGLMPASAGVIGPAGDRHPSLRWLRLPQGGKARALNVAVTLADTELVLTVDADTLLQPGALAAMRQAFADDPALVAATGVLDPVCVPTAWGQVLQWFQTYEYVRNFLSRYAWMRMGGLLLISGAFACYRRQPLLAVGGFDPDCLVEDYELTHRLRDHAVRAGLVWHTGVVGGAQGRTEAPATVPAFLRQRRRWFGGFLQTQYWYRHMVGDRAYGRLGTMMLPVKAFDTLQPLYGLSGVALLVGFLVTGRFGVAGAVFVAIGAKIAFDIAFHLWSLRLYRRWLGQAHALSPGWAILASVIEPFSFQLLRHLGAALGWTSLLRRTRSW